MPRPVRTDISAMLQEARALEMYATEIEVAPDRLQDYWSLSADLIALVADIEEFQTETPDATYENPAMFVFKQRLRGVAARLGQMAES